MAAGWQQVAPPSPTGAARLSAREQKLNLEANLPFGSYVGADGVMIRAYLCIHRLLPDTENLTDRKPQRYRPLLT
jgi:hypothetical protein